MSRYQNLCHLKSFYRNLLPFLRWWQLLIQCHYKNWVQILTWNAWYQENKNSQVDIPVVAWDIIKINLRLCAWALSNNWTFTTITKLKWSYYDSWFASYN